MNLVEDLKKDLEFAFETDLELSEYIQSIINQLEEKRIALKLSDISDLTNEQVEEIIIKNIKELKFNVKVNGEEIEHNFSSTSKKRDFLLSYTNKTKQEFIESLIDTTIKKYEYGETNNPLGYAIMHSHGFVDSRVLKQRLIEKGIKL